MGKVLIIGNRGMLGQELVRAFKDSNPLLWDRQEIDIANQRQVNRLIADRSPDLIINTAAYTDVDSSESNQKLASQVNGNAVEYLAKAASEVGAVFIHYSSDYVFDGKNKQGYREDDQPSNPVNAYGQSKILGEKLLQDNCQKYYLIRSSGLFGQYGKNFVDTILNLAKSKKEVKVVKDQFLKPTYAFDLAKVTKELIDKRYKFGIYHLTNGKTVNWYDFAREICRIYSELNKVKLGKICSCLSKEFPRPAKRPKYGVLLNTKTKPLRPWPEALREYLIIKKRPV